MFKELGWAAIIWFSVSFALLAEEPKPQVIVLDDPDREIVWIDASGEVGETAKSAIAFGSTPQSGTSGASGGHVTLVVRQLPEKVVIDAHGGNGGHGANGARGKYGLPGADGKNAGLFSSAKEGQDGTDGQGGGDGSHGGHGGKGGVVRIVYVPEHNYDPRWKEHFEITVNGGKGGEAGWGGLGGIGGAPGQGGKKFWSSNRVSSGRRGLNGGTGREGVAGSEGEEGIVEFIELENLQDFLLEEFLRSS